MFVHPLQVWRNSNTLYGLTLLNICEALVYKYAICTWSIIRIRVLYTMYICTVLEYYTLCTVCVHACVRAYDLRALHGFFCMHGLHFLLLGSVLTWVATYVCYMLHTYMCMLAFANSLLVMRWWCRSPH